MPITTRGISPLPTWVDDLSPATREILGFFMRKLTLGHGNLHIPAPAQSDADRVLQAYNPASSTSMVLLAKRLSLTELLAMDE
jgi:hypothetical protein